MNMLLTYKHLSFSITKLELIVWHQYIWLIENYGYRSPKLYKVMFGVMKVINLALHHHYIYIYTISLYLELIDLFDINIYKILFIHVIIKYLSFGLGRKGEVEEIKRRNYLCNECDCPFFLWEKRLKVVSYWWIEK